MGTRYEEDEELDYSFLRLSTQEIQKRTEVRPQAGNRQTGQRTGVQSVRSSQNGPGQRRSGADWGNQSRFRQDRQGKKQTGKGQRNGGQSVQGKQGQRSPQQSISGWQNTKQAAALAARKRRIRRQRRVLAVLLCLLLLGSVFAVLKLQREAESMNGRGVYAEQPGDGMGLSSLFGEKIQGIDADWFQQHPEWTEDFLTISEYSRPGDPLKEVKNIFVHYTANPNTSAAQNRNYFENLKDMHDVPGASAHFIIGINGEILQIVPLDEMAYAVKTRNEDSISIECCYKSKDGQFTQETYDSLITLLAWLVDTYGLDTEDILRHYDCGGKKCPLYYVDHEDAWRILKQDVGDARK